MPGHWNVSKGPVGTKIPTPQSTQTYGSPGYTGSTGFVDKPKVQSTQSAWSPAAGSTSNNIIKKDNTIKKTNNTTSGSWYPGVGNDTSNQINTTVTGTTWPGASHAGAGAWHPGVGSTNNKSNNTITIHNDDGSKNTGDFKGNVGSDDYNWKFGSITTKNNTFLNTENDEVMETYKKINQLKLLNPTWTDLEAANYLNYGTTDRKYRGTKGKAANAGSEDVLKDGLMNTWGMGIRGDYNFGKAMDVASYSNGLDWVSANANQMSPEDVKIQRAILDGTKKFKKPSKFGEFFKDMPSLANIIDKVKNIQPTRESFDTEVGSVGWDNLALRQLERTELMPDGSSPYDYLKNHQNEDYNKLANKYSMIKPDDYKPMKWFKERHLSPEEVAEKNARFPGADMFYEEELVGVDGSWGGNERWEDQREELNKKIKTELENNEIDVIDGIRVDGDIVNLNKAFQKGPELDSNDNEIKDSVYNYSNNSYNEEETTPDEKTDTTPITKYVDPQSRAGGFEALFGMPYSPHLENAQPEDIKTYLDSHAFAGKSYTWDENTGKYRVFDESAGLSYLTPEELRLELDL